jgi:hypothetical protein
MQDCAAIFETELIVAYGVSGCAHMGGYSLHNVVPIRELINVTGEDTFLNPFSVALQYLDDGEPVAVTGYVVTNYQKVRHGFSDVTYTMKYSALSGAAPQPCQRTFF